jgi:hypothetical protein
VAFRLSRWIDGDSILGWFADRAFVYEVNGRRV